MAIRPPSVKGLNTTASFLCILQGQEVHTSCVPVEEKELPTLSDLWILYSKVFSDLLQHQWNSLQIHWMTYIFDDDNSLLAHSGWPIASQVSSPIALLQRQFLLVDFVLFWSTISLLPLKLCNFVTYRFSWNFATLWFLLRYSIVGLPCCVQQSDSVTHTYIYTFFFIFFSIMVYHRILSVVPCAI